MKSFGRTAGLVAAILVVVLVAVVVFGVGASHHRVEAIFKNASQLVKGNLVQVAGAPVGKVTDLRLTPAGEADVTLQIDNGSYWPLRQGTIATVRQASLSGIANRYVDLRLAPATRARHPRRRPHHRGADQQRRRPRPAVRHLRPDHPPRPERRDRRPVDDLRRSQRRPAARVPLPQPGARRLERPVRRARPRHPASDPVRRRQLEARHRPGRPQQPRHRPRRPPPPRHGDRQSADRARRIDPPAARLPRRADTTFLNLRPTLDDLTKLVDDTKPVAKQLRPFLQELRPLARDARPTLRILQQLIENPRPPTAICCAGAHDGPGPRDRRRPRPGQRPAPGGDPGEHRRARHGDARARLRPPYSPDLTAWFNSFAHSGVYDALGGASRVAIFGQPARARQRPADADPARAAPGGARLDADHRPAQPLPRGGRARQRRRLEPLPPAGLPLRPDPGPAGQ